MLSVAKALGHLQRAGHTPVVLIGGATGLIGDPSGRETERILLAHQDAKNNAEKVTVDALRVLERAMDANGPRPIVVNNADWWSKISSMDLLRDIGQHFRVPTMLRRESVSRRMQSQEGISFTEFSYQLLQSHDFFHLHKTSGVCVQIGGSDQWGNITAGIEYAKRRNVSERLAGLTLPLISTKDGNKLGKSAGNAVWLAPEKTSHLDLYQLSTWKDVSLLSVFEISSSFRYFVQNATDEVVGQWLHLLTLLPTESIARVCAQGGGASQKELAYRVVELVRGTDAAEEARRASLALFGGSAGDAPQLAMSREKLAKITLVEVMVESGLAPSKV